MNKETITIKDFLNNQSKYKNYVVYEWVGNESSANGSKLTLQDLKKRNPNEIGWLDYTEDYDGYDDETGQRLIIPIYSFNLGYSLLLKRNIWEKGEHN